MLVVMPSPRQIPLPVNSSSLSVSFQISLPSMPVIVSLVPAISSSYIKTPSLSCKSPIEIVGKVLAVWFARLSVAIWRFFLKPLLSKSQFLVPLLYVFTKILGRRK